MKSALAKVFIFLALHVLSTNSKGLLRKNGENDHQAEDVNEQSLSTDSGAVCSCSENLELRLGQLEDDLASLIERLVLPRDCADALARGKTESGVYEVQPDNVQGKIEVFCDMETDGGGWTVFQRQKSGSITFHQTYEVYRLGFGDLEGDFWLGNDNLNMLTSQDKYELRVDLRGFKQQELMSSYAVYSSFHVADEHDDYRLTVEGYSGTAEDGLYFHKNMRFSTYDRDNDMASQTNCAADCFGGWWYNKCYRSNLNARFYRFYHYNMAWPGITPVSSEMKFRPAK